MESEIQESKERYALAARAADDGLWDWDLKTNEIYYCPRWKSMLGFADHEIGHEPDEWLDRVYRNDLGHLLGKLADHLHRGAARFSMEHRLLHRDGRYRWMHSRGIALRSESGEPTRIVGSQSDITDRKKAEDRLRHDASHDALTGLPNRAEFESQLQRTALRAQRRSDRLFALLMVDLDGFKSVNDNFGHQVGDCLLAGVADRLRQCIRPGDHVARLGGDEFGVLLREIESPSDAAIVARRIQEELSTPFPCGRREVTVGAGIGVAIASDDYEQPADLVRDADAAMYRAKARGPAECEIFDSRRSAEDLEVLGSERRLSEALERGEFGFLYQPFALPSTGEAVGVEALLRWNHPERGWIATREIIRAVGEKGNILTLSRWIMEQICRQARAWEQAGAPLPVSVNVSGDEIRRPEFVAMMRDVLRDAGTDPKCLRLEVSEPTLARGGSEVAERIRELVALGVRVDLDNFGGAYSSLIYLRRFPIDGVKIDVSLVHQADEARADPNSTSGIVELAHDMSFSVAVTGAETEDDLAFLGSVVCERIQGHIVAPPLDTAGYDAFLRRYRTPGAAPFHSRA